MRQQEQQIHDEHPEAVRSEPVAVPLPADQDDIGQTTADHNETDQTLVDQDDPDQEQLLDRPDDAEYERTPGRTEFHEPANQPTAFGAPTVGGAAAAAALASGVPADERDARDEDTVRSGDGAVEGGATDRTEQDAHSRTDAVNGSVVPGGTLPGGVPAEPVTALIPATAAREFRDRWREVQLRFVDDPQAAATQARKLAEEAIDAMTTALARQRDELSGWQQHESRDTEQLRVAVRRYRDLLDRMLGD